MATPEFKAFPLREAYKFAEENGLKSEVQEIREMDIEWDRNYTTGVRKGRLIELLENRNLYDRFVKQVWPFGNTGYGVSQKQHKLKIWEDYKHFQNGDVTTSSSEEEQAHNALRFAMETHLRDFLAKNLDRVEPGLRIYQAEGKNGVEYVLEDGRIDLLAIDRHGKYVVIELKLSRGRNKALGQLLYYMGWVDRNLGNGPCRGAIIAHEITEDLKVAVSRAPGIFMAQYEMSFSVAHV